MSGVPKGWLDDLQPGDTVVILVPPGRGSARVASTTVERVLKRDLVLTNGERFNRQNTSAGNLRLVRREGGTWGWQTFLAHPNDPEVARTRRHIHVSRLRSQAISVYDAWHNRRSDDDADAGERARAVAAAFTALADAEA